MTMMCVFGRLMSQLADVNTHSTVGMCHFHHVLHCSFCTTGTVVLEILSTSCHHQHVGLFVIPLSSLPIV